MHVNEEQLAFYHAVGRAVTNWAHVEWAVGSIAQVSLQGTHEQTLAVAFLGIENFRSKLEFTKRAFNNTFDGHKRQPEALGLFDEVEALAKRRNEIVHRMVMMFPGAKPGRRVALIPWIKTATKIKSNPAFPPPGALCVKDIDLARARFGRASSHLIDLASDLFGRPMPPGWIALLEPQSQTLPQLVSQIRGYMKQPPLS